jgi:tetratricopeptide (TPR) repeat protein
MLRVVCPVVLWCVFANQVFANQDGDYVSLALRARGEYSKGEISASEASLEAALHTLRPDEDRYRAATLADLGTLYLNKDEHSKSEHAFFESLDIYRRLSDQSNVVRILTSLGGLYSIQGRGEEALKMLRQALKIANANRENPVPTIQVLNSFGVVYCRQGKYSKAESFLTQAMGVASKAGISVRTPQLLHNLGVVYYKKREFKKAEDLLLEALRLTEADIGPSHPDLFFVISVLADLYTKTGRYPEAEQQLRRALTILRTAKADYSTRIARVLHALGLMYNNEGRKADAEASMAEAGIIARKNLAKNADMVTIVQSYSVTLKRQGKVREAKELWDEAERARIAAGLVVNVRSSF